MVATAIYSVTMVLWKETAFPLCRAMERRWKRNVVSRVSSVIVVTECGTLYVCVCVCDSSDMPANLSLLLFYTPGSIDMAHFTLLSCNNKCYYYHHYFIPQVV